MTTFIVHSFQKFKKCKISVNPDTTFLTSSLPVSDEKMFNLILYLMRLGEINVDLSIGEIKTGKIWRLK
jgi:hypothetical protein